jgi:hypothetical protein
MVIKLVDKKCAPKVVRDDINGLEVSFSISHDPSDLMTWLKGSLHPEEMASFTLLWTTDNVGRQYVRGKGCVFITFRS